MKGQGGIVEFAKDVIWSEGFVFQIYAVMLLQNTERLFAYKV